VTLVTPGGAGRRYISGVINRRNLLLGGIAATALQPIPAWADTDSTSGTWLPEKWRESGFPTRRWVNILFVNTGERFKDFYMEDGNYIVPAVKHFSWVCRDFRRNEWAWLEPHLMDLLFVLHWKYNINEIKILSGYRSPEPNANIEGAALHSQHTLAKALDVHLSGVDNVAVARDFKLLIAGGVGMYPQKHFTHLDWGPLRNWVG
jgi:uncharacterized protein YcbK (DUF882 family)